MLNIKSLSKLIIYIYLSLLHPGLVASEKLPLGEVPPLLKLEGNGGGRVDGKPWSSLNLVGKVHVLFYVAPSQKELNRQASDAIKKEKFPREKYASIAVVNMAASSWPNFILSTKIKSSQKEFPHTLYLKDVDRAFVKNWDLKDNSNCVLVFGTKSEVLFRFCGKLPETKIKEMLSILRANIVK